jgi:hypothetical protein
MRLGKWGATALLLSVAFCVSQNTLQAQYGDENGQYRSAYDAAQAAGDSLASYASYSQEEISHLDGEGCASGECYSEGECNACQGGGSSMGDFTQGYKKFLRRPGQFFAGATYIYARADYSEALAYVESDPVAGGETFHMYDFNYNSSYGVDGGYRLCDCGGEIRFSYLRLQSDASFAAASVQGGSQIFTPYEVDGNVQGSANTDLHSYDLGFSKTIPLGSPLGCCDSGCCDSVGCGDGCGCGWCPAWDLTWSVGVRYVDLDSSRNTSAFDPGPIFVDSAGMQLDFQGAGPRMGVMGRRYLGRCGRFSLFAKGDISLLLGDVDLNIQGVGQAGPGGFTKAEFNNIIPETDIEVGGTIHIRNRFNLSAGYFFTVFHDLGMRDEYDFNQFQLSHFDDANILGFDGFFARAEVTF